MNETQKVTIMTPKDALELASRIVRETVPTAVCELQDYQFRIGCGEMDKWGNVHDVKVTKGAWNEENFRHAAQVLAAKLKTGGSTSG